MKIMVAPDGRGGIKSVVEAYKRDGLIHDEQFSIVHTYVEGSVAKRVWTFARALLKLTGLVIRQRPDLVHIHAAMRGSFWRKSIVASAMRLAGIPTIIHLHGSEMKEFYSSQSKTRKKIIKYQLEEANCVIVLSRSWKMFVLSIAPNSNVEIVPNYINMKNIPHHKVPRTESVLFLGAIGQRKGVFDLISSFSAVVARFPNVKLLVGGNGAITEAQDLVDKLGLTDSVELLGWIDDKAKFNLLQKASIYVLPSYNEGLPLSVLEAMASGVPTITTTVGGLPELIDDGVNGILLEPGDQAALSRNVIALLSDEALRNQLGEAGRIRVEQRYSSVAILPKLTGIYRSIIERGSLSKEKH